MIQGLNKLPWIGRRASVERQAHGARHPPAVGVVDRALARGTRRGLRNLQQFADETREARIGLALSQATVGAAVGISQPQISRIEQARLPNLSVVDASRIASVLGLDLVVRTYPAGTPLRDAGHAERLRRVLKHVRAPLRYRTDVPLPQRPDQPPEQRAWDALLDGGDRRTGIEVEMRLRDVQATIRRHALKRRDDPVDGFLLVLADTRTNRRLFSEIEDLFPELPRVRMSRVVLALEHGVHPPSGVVFI